MTQNVNLDSEDCPIDPNLDLAGITTLDDRASHYRSLLERTAAIVWEIDRSGEASGEQLGWTAFTGQTFDRAKAGGWLEAVHPEDRALTIRAWTAATAGGTPYHVEYQLRHHSGEYRWMDVQGLPVLAPDGTIAQWFGCHVDITDRKIAELAVQAQAQELTQLNLLLAQMTMLVDRRTQELDQFSYTISHDLKAPLRAIANLSEWIESDLTGQIDAQNQQQLQLLRSRAKRLQAMIDGVLEYSRIGRTEVRIETVAVAESIADLVDTIAPPANFEISIATDLPTIETKRKLLERVFANLIDNAIVHHQLSGTLDPIASTSTRPSGHIQITGQPLTNSYEFAVTDDGQGIPPEHHESIFGMFKTLSNKSDRLGIGLAIVKKIVESEGGQIRLSSTVGAGTTVRFTWSGSLSVKG